MSSANEIDPAVLQLATEAGYETTFIERTSGSRIEFSTGLGEVRMIVDVEADGIVTISRSDRLEQEYLEFAAPQLDTVERHLLTSFGPAVRRRRNMPRIRVPVDASDIAPGFEIAREPFRDSSRPALVRLDGAVVAWSRDDPVIAELTLVELSHHMEGSLTDLIASYVDASGMPLFGRFVKTS